MNCCTQLQACFCQTTSLERNHINRFKCGVRGGAAILLTRCLRFFWKPSRWFPILPFVALVPSSTHQNKQKVCTKSVDTFISLTEPNCIMYNDKCIYISYRHQFEIFITVAMLCSILQTKAPYFQEIKTDFRILIECFFRILPQKLMPPCWNC